MRQNPGRARRRLAAASIVLGLAGCAGPSYVVLLPNDDGTTGKVIVAARDGTTVLDKSHDAATIGGPAGKRYVVSDEKIAKDFGSALAASPMPPAIFLIYFETGGTLLTAESKAGIPKIVDAISQRPAPDISIIGHTDTIGKDDENVSLGLSRARFMAKLLDRVNLGTRRITVDSHGEKNPLIATPDHSAEPRNRRVEVTVR